jgi:nucleoside-diphosphate-sugar epimerase
MSTILLTGGAGFLGSVLINRLLANGDHHIVCLDPLRYGIDSILPYLDDSRFTFIEGSVTDESLLQALFDSYTFSHVVHLGALVGEALCSKHQDLAKEVNLEGTKTLLDFAKVYGAPHILFTSTCSNYGISEGLATETSELKPLSLYAETKVDAEREVMKYPSFTILRFATLYGFSPRLRLDLMINEWVADAIYLQKISVYNPTAHRPFLHVRDAAKCITQLLNRVLIKEVFNVGDFNITKGELAETIAEEVPCKITYTDTKGDTRDYQVSFESVARAIGFQPSNKLRTRLSILRQGISSVDIDNPMYNNVSGFTL